MAGFPIMRSFCFFLFSYCFFTFIAFANVGVAGSSDFDEQVKKRLYQQLDMAGLTGVLNICTECVYDRNAVRDFYLSRDYNPAWIVEGQPGPGVRELIQTISEARDHGLVPDHYHLKSIHTFLEDSDSKFSVETAASLDLLLTDSFLVLGSHFLSGRINPTTIDPEWLVRLRNGNIIPTLSKALADGNVRGELQALLPRHSTYTGLTKALANYRKITDEGGWPMVPDGSTLRIGDRNPRVAFLKQRLAVERDLSQEVAEGDFFDEHLSAAVRRFQVRHGLETDALVGRNTLTALNVSAAERLQQIELNLERWRWLPEDLGERYIIVNIAAFELDLMENTDPVLAMRVVVGKPFRRTPVMSGTITYLVLNPGWEVPTSIASKDILPKIIKDRQFLSKMGFRLFSGWRPEDHEVDPESVDWNSIRPGTFPFRLIQEPGPGNALGRIKFMFHNPHDVYLHDTSSKALFSKEFRTFSSGCIRLENPLELAGHLLRGTPLAHREALEMELASEETRTVRLLEPVPVHLLYWTAWADNDGTIHFRNDVYGRDLILEKAMEQPPPRAFYQ